MFQMFNAPMPTTTVMAKVSTGTAIKTMLQLAVPAARQFEIVEWGISFDGYTAAVPITVDLVETDVAATVTAHVAAGITKTDDPNGAASAATLSASGTGYTATVEGSTTAVRVGDAQLISPTAQYVRIWQRGEGFVIQPGKFARIRVLAPASVAALCHMKWREL